jgi:hypothetical protein
MKRLLFLAALFSLLAVLRAHADEPVVPCAFGYGQTNATCVENFVTTSGTTSAVLAKTTSAVLSATAWPIGQPALASLSCLLTAISRSTTAL